MQAIGASKASLSSISTEALWRQSGRYSSNSELLRINDRRESGFLLSPTHEEEVTALVASMAHSYKDLPLRLYQVGRKYRDERRPRQGLLRAKEFMMKDLYTFDSTHSAALETYDAVRKAYTSIFDAFKLPYLVADADSGNMGGNLSHEYHFPSPKGEDNVWSCSSCSYVANEELVEKAPDVLNPEEFIEPFYFRGISTDRKTRIDILVPPPKDVDTKLDEVRWDRIGELVNLHAVKRYLARKDIELDTGIEAAALQQLLSDKIHEFDQNPMEVFDRAVYDPESDFKEDYIDLTPIVPGSPCPKCDGGTLNVTKAIEAAHTFHLGTRYSEPLGALVAQPDGKTRDFVHMGCHGIGVSRIIGAVASLLKDEKGLNWPKVIAPYEVIILPSRQRKVNDAMEVYDTLGDDIDVVLDDRADKSLGWKLGDADLIGYPVIVVLGRAWEKNEEVEVQCRRLSVKKNVSIERLREEVQRLLEQL